MSAGEYIKYVSIIDIFFVQRKPPATITAKRAPFLIDSYSKFCVSLAFVLFRYLLRAWFGFGVVIHGVISRNLVFAVSKIDKIHL